MGTTGPRSCSKMAKCAVSAPFSVGGHSWVIEYYPNGFLKKNIDYISAYVVLDSSFSKDVKVKIRFNLMDKNGVPASSFKLSSSLCTFSCKGSYCGYPKFFKKSSLEESEYIVDDCFTINCEVTVMKEIHSEQTKQEQVVVVPPSNLHQHFGDLLKSMDGTGVIFEVDGEKFSAHRCVLAARSSVFKAELFGSMRETTCSHIPIKIDDMKGDVFKSLLYFFTQTRCSRSVKTAPMKNTHVQ